MTRTLFFVDSGLGKHFVGNVWGAGSSYSTSDGVGTLRPTRLLTIASSSLSAFLEPYCREPPSTRRLDGRRKSLIGETVMETLAAARLWRGE